KASWTYTKSQAEVASAFGIPDVASIDLSNRTAGGAVRTATARSTSGGTSTLSGSALRSTLELPGAWLHKPVVRIAGADRYETAAKVAGQLGSAAGNQAVIASGDPGHLADALSAAGAAGGSGRPVLLVARDSVPPATSQALHDDGITSTVVIGGPA